MKARNNFKAVTLIAAAFLKSNSKIVDDGLWTGHDYYMNDMKLGVKDGIPYSNDNETKRRINSSMAVDGDASDYKSKDNVKRVMRVMNEDSWNELFSLRDSLYTYDGFLHAAGKYEAFCGESNLDDYDDDETCKRELSTLFAHFAQETGLHDSEQPVEEWM